MLRTLTSVRFLFRRSPWRKNKRLHGPSFRHAFKRAFFADIVLDLLFTFVGPKNAFTYVIR